MSFFEELKNTSPWVKAGFEGFAGSGKSFTASLLAIGLALRIKTPKPIAVFDTEEAFGFLKPRFDAAGLKAIRKRSRSLADLKEAMKLCREGVSDILIVDSLSHIWEAFCDAYREKKHRAYLQFQDWGELKSLWRAEFSIPFVRDPYHAIFCGRAAYEYSEERNEEGKREIHKSGIKMTVEKETAYEPHLLVLMERLEDVIEKDRREVHHGGVILKDRSGTIDGKAFLDPVYKTFEPAIEAALANPAPKIRAEADPGVLIENEDERAARKKAHEIALEEIEGVLKLIWPGSTTEEKKLKGEAIFVAFQTTSWAKVTTLATEQLTVGFEVIRRFIFERTGRKILPGTRASEKPAPGNLQEALGVKPGECPFGDLPDGGAPKKDCNPPVLSEPAGAREGSREGAATSSPEQGVTRATPGVETPPRAPAGPPSGGALPDPSQASPGPEATDGSSTRTEADASSSSETECPGSISKLHWWNPDKTKCLACGLAFPGVTGPSVEYGKAVARKTGKKPRSAKP